VLSVGIVSGDFLLFLFFLYIARRWFEFLVSTLSALHLAKVYFVSLAAIDNRRFYCAMQRRMAA
jgi:hypothetical protein